MVFDNRHNQPGRRFATGAHWDDIMLGAFGFISHMFFFMFAGALVQYFVHGVDNFLFLGFTGVVALICLVIRGHQVGITTTKESIAAIVTAAKGRPNEPMPPAPPIVPPATGKLNSW